eukprot:6233322-Pyramimonas_sp.AAC.1
MLPATFAFARSRSAESKQLWSWGRQGAQVGSVLAASAGFCLPPPVGLRRRGVGLPGARRRGPSP